MIKSFHKSSLDAIMGTMDEKQNPIVPPNASPDAVNATGNIGNQEGREEEVPIDRVFEISPDLDIKPVTNPDEQVPRAPGSIPTQEQPKTGLQDEIGKLNIEAAIYRASKAQGTVRGSASNLQGSQNGQMRTTSSSTPVKPSIPLQDFSGALNKAQTQSSPAMTSSPTNQPTQSPIQGQNIQGQKPTTQPQSQQPQPIIMGENGNKVAEPVKPVEEKGNFVQKALRTYEGDIAEFMAKRKTSVASMAIAENEREGDGTTIGTEQSDEKQPSHAGKKLLLLFLSLFLIGAGSVGSYYLYRESPLAPRTPAVPTAQAPMPLVPYDYQTIVPIDGMLPYQMIERVQTEMLGQQAPNTIKEVVFSSNSGERQVRVTGPEMLRIMDIPAPDTLARTITSDWMFGIYADENGERSVFVVAGTDYFQNAFAGMLVWESVMADDLRQYLTPSSVMGVANVLEQIPVNPNTDPLEGLENSLPLSADIASTSIFSGLESGGAIRDESTSTATTTVANEPQNRLEPYQTLRGRFTDRIIGNKDVRSFETDLGETLFLYSFVANDKLVVAGDKAALSEILARLERQAFVR